MMTSFNLRASAAARRKIAAASLMTSWARAATLGAAALAVMMPGAFVPVAAAESAPPDLRRQAELIRLVRQDCGSCHGLKLTGGLGPPLTRQALADKPFESMWATIIHGRPGTPMPAWSTLLTPGEATWITRQLFDGFPKEAEPAR